MSELTELRHYLATRRSVTLPFLTEPGPSAEQLDEIMTLGVRVPDHGKLAPWRLVVYQGDARHKVGEKLAAIRKAQSPDISEELLDMERKQFLPAPVTIGVISTAGPHPKIPDFEQLLSAGCVAFNLFHAANALGFGAHWVTRWFAYDGEAAAMLGAEDGERFVGFVHIGTPEQRLPDRDRPNLSDIVTYWQD